MSDIIAHQRSLPIFPHKARIQSVIESNAVVIIVGLTGCGKTTQIPQYLSECSNHFCQCRKHRRLESFANACIGISQPRRVAAITVAHRVAYERRVPIGTKVVNLHYEDD